MLTISFWNLALPCYGNKQNSEALDYFQEALAVRKNIFPSENTLKKIPSTEGRVLRKKLNAFVCLWSSKVKGQKNISHRNIEISIFTLKEGSTVDEGVLPGSKEHRLPGSKVKKTFLIKTSKS
jgi:hypothetical protein